MKFQVGDRVIVLHSHEQGEVVDIINEEMVMVEVRGVRFPAYIDQLDYPNKPVEAPLDFDSLVAKGIKIYNAKEARRHLPPARTVVDLHIEKISNDWNHLTNPEILDIQLREFEKWYDLAVAHRQAQLISENCTSWI